MPTVRVLQHMQPQVTLRMSDNAGSKKGKKSKGLALTAMQETALLAITGALRFLTLLDVNKVRLQQLGAVTALVTLATKAARASLRYNAQSILSKYCMPWVFAIWHVWEPGLPRPLERQTFKGRLERHPERQSQQAVLESNLRWQRIHA